MGEQGSTSLSLQELGRQTGELPERLREWRSLGLIGAPGQDAFGLRDVERVRLIQFCVRRGLSAETIVRAEEAEGDFLGRYLDQLFPSGIEPTWPLEEAAELAGLDAEPVRRFGDIVGLFDAGERVDRHDIEILRGWKIALDAGLPEDALFQLVRVYADSLGRVGEAEARLFHFYVHERLRDGGLSGLALREQTDAASQRMQELIEPAILYFHRKALAKARREDLLLHLADYSGEADTSGAPGQLRVAIVFLDLASFTPLTESMGDAAAAEVVARFSELVRESVNRHHGRVVERIGDAFMLAFTDSRDAVSSALDIEERTTQEAQFPALRGPSISGRFSTERAGTSDRT
jgi:adenylate cyclase